MAIQDGQGGRPLKIPDNRFINFMVKCPCVTAVITGVISLITVFITVRIIMANGEDIIADSTAYDVADIRSRQYEAYEVSVKMAEMFADGQARECDATSCDTSTYPPLTLNGQVVLMVFAASEGSSNVFEESGIAQMKSVFDRITGHQNHSDFCKREDRSGQSTDCSLPLSPLRLFYGTPLQGTVQSLVTTLDAMDGSTDGELNVFRTSGLSPQLSQLSSNFMTTYTALLRGEGNGCATSGTRADAANPLVLNCMVGAAAAQTGADQTATDVYRAMFPVVAAWTRPPGNTLQDVPSVLKLAAYMKEVEFFAPYVDYYFDKGFSVANPVSKYCRGMIQYGAPLTGFINKNDRKEEQDEIFGEWFDTQFVSYLKDTSDLGNIEVLFFATPLIREEFLKIIISDSMKVLVSLVLVFLWIWIQTNSIFIAIVGALEILFSIPLAFLLYYTVFGFKYFDGLNFMTLFIVVAIGADDIFVFMDQYKQSAYIKEACVDLKTRMNWVYARASWAMFITSATTCAAFVTTAANPLPNIQSFGIFSAFVITVDYLLVITWFPACVVLYHNYLENRPCLLCCHRCQELFPCSLKMETSTARICAMGPEQTPQKRMLERGISGPFAGFIRRFAIPILVFFLLLLIPAGILASGIQPLSSSEEFLPADHPFQRLWTISGTEFPTSAETPNTDVHLVWGVSDMDMSDVNLLRNGAKQQGELVWDDTFQFDEACQQHIWNVCEEARRMEVEGLSNFLSLSREDGAANQGDVECPVFAWKQYLERTGGEGWPLPLAQVPTVMANFLESSAVDGWGRNVTIKDVWKKYIGFDSVAGEVKLIRVTVKSRLPRNSAHLPDTLTEHYNYFEDWIAELNSDTGRLAAPASANKVFQVSEGQQNGPNWVWMHTQSIFRTSAIQGAIIGTVIAFVVILIATQQIIIALSAFLTIASILVSVLACMKIASYELGSIASICITILAGFAVDYVVHLAHAFNHSKMAARTEKVQEAFDDIGVSVLSGAVTSILAAAVLVSCVLQFFAKFGFFLICTVVWAWIWGNLFFMGLMKVIGPDEGTHWILQLPHSILPARPSFCSRGTTAEATREHDTEAVLPQAVA
mmetsp:Transcript_111187/g.270183  ORF Transcript_111187/g.270183 Transcript_111187/m.270183 type:complete len:1096 (-) Transcript_111187:138-3425(-)